MPRSKTAGQWFRAIKNEGIRRRALTNYLNRPTKPPSHKYTSLNGALGGGFIWMNTPEGDGYWRNVHRRAELGEIL
jgi:hypothetical protein